MNNNLLLSLALKITPILAICFVLLLLLHKIYFKIRSKYNVKVNCWFCNQNTKVPYLNKNNWTCPQCEQYNGFTKDGDYNREIFQQLDCSNLATKNQPNQSGHSDTCGSTTLPTPKNGFCDVCNEAQRLKIEKLAQFEPKNESRFNEELKVYKAQLEEQYRLCGTCDRHLHKVLREKKKMVLGTKFLDYIIRSAEKLQEPHLNELRREKREKYKQKLARLITIIAIINIGCLISILPTLRRETMTEIFGETLGQQLFIIASHFLAFGRVIGTYIGSIGEKEICVKLKLFLRTITMMTMYSLGLRWPQIMHSGFSAFFVQATPFLVICLSFVHKIMDALKLTRFTFVMIVWSAVAGGIFNMQELFMPNFLILLTSVITLMLSVTYKMKPSPKLHDNSVNSFHKIYSEDYLSDEDSASMLSQEFTCSNSSIRSFEDNLNNSFHHMASNRLQHQTKSPFTSSTYSLHGLQQPRQISPNSSFNTCIQQPGQMHNQSFMHASFEPGMYNFARPTPSLAPMSPRSTIYASNFELNRPDRSISVMPQNNSFLNQSFVSCAYAPPQQQLHLNNSAFSSSFNVNPLQETSFSSAQPPQRGFSVAPMPSMHSPFSVSTNAVYQERATNLLTPSRFSSNCLLSNRNNADVNTWLVGNCFEERPFQNDVFGMKALEENLSRASSRSSGFESQNGPMNASRENSCIPDVTELAKPTISLDNTLGFRPIHGSMYANSNGCNSSYLRRTSTSAGTRDSFNLRKINEELPTIQRGDLLRKWKESQLLS